MSKRAEKAKWGPESEKGRKSDGMRAKGRAACFKVGPRVPSSRAARDDHAPSLHLRAKRHLSSHGPSPHTSFDHPGMSIWNPGRDRHANRDELRGNPYLGGNVCAKILSDPLQLGPRAKTLRQEVHFSYHTQLSDRQELLRSSRNLSQKMTPWHKEHSNGLLFARSYLANPSSPLCKACTVEKVFLTRNKLIHKPGHVGKKTHSCTTWNSRIAKNLSGSAGILIGKLPSNGPKTPPVASVRGAISHKSKLGFPQIRNLAKSRQRKLSDGTKNVKIRNLGQIQLGQDLKKKRAGRKTHFFLPDSRLRAQSLSCSQQVDPRARVRWKDNDSSYVVELSVRRKHPPFDRNLHRKSARKQLRYPDFREP
uniref:Uncharacterized protein n=1 Tax=Fagus sylvatica TaxID=28930 RepID=A0A2N9FY00_FAGSY